MPDTTEPARTSAVGGSERNLGQVLDALLDGVVVVDRQGRVERLNAEACRVLGISGEAVAGRAAEALPAGDLLAGRIRECLGRGQAQLESEVLLPGGSETAAVARAGGRGSPLVDLATAPLIDDAGTVDGAVLLLRDRSVGATLREAHEARARNELFGCFATGIAHEVRNPLGGIRGAAELLVGRAHDGRSRRTAELILGEVDRIAALLDELLVFAPGKELALAPVNLHRVLDDVLSLLACDPLAATAEIERSFDPSLPELWADGDRLRQVFLNLGRNALEAMGESERARLGVLDPAGARSPHRSRGGGLDAERCAERLDRGLGHRLRHPRGAAALRGDAAVLDQEPGDGARALAEPPLRRQHRGTLQILSPPSGGTTVRVALPLRRLP